MGEVPSGGRRLRTKPTQAVGDQLVTRGMFQKPVRTRQRNPVARGVWLGQDLCRRTASWLDRRTVRAPSIDPEGMPAMTRFGESVECSIELPAGSGPSPELIGGP